MAAVANPLTIPKLKPRSIDELCARRAALLAELDEINAGLKAQVDAHGYTPAKAEKSKRLDGLEYEVTLSYGETTEIRDAAVERIKTVCAPEVFASLFREVSSYKLASGATMVLAQRKLPEGSPSNLRQLFAAAVVLKQKAPSLRIKRLGGDDAPPMEATDR